MREEGKHKNTDRAGHPSICPNNHPTSRLTHRTSPFVRTLHAGIVRSDITERSGGVERQEPVPSAHKLKHFHASSFILSRDHGRLQFSVLPEGHTVDVGGGIPKLELESLFEENVVLGQ